MTVAPAITNVVASGPEAIWPMQELMRSNDAVLISFVDALLKDSQIPHFVADVHMSILDGSIGVLPRRVLVDPDHLDKARRLLQDAELGHELS